MVGLIIHLEKKQIAVDLSLYFFISDRQLPFSQRCALNGRLPRRVSPVQSGGVPHIAHEWPPHRWIWSPGGWRLRRPASRCDRGT